MRGATKGGWCYLVKGKISIHAPREGRDVSNIIIPAVYDISIHAPREGRDGRGVDKGRAHMISIHAPREGRDSMRESWLDRDSLFQSTRPVRGATFATLIPSTLIGSFQSTRPVRGATGYHREVSLGVGEISIHAPREGRDFHRHYPFSCNCISTHAPREGRDRREENI